MRFVKEDLAKVGTSVYRSARQNALRLTITETNMAYNYANCKRWSDEPFVLGINIRLSGNHPADDICDELEGDYPKDFMWRGWHPRCMCVCSSILMDRDSEEWKKLRSMSTEEYNAYKSPNNIKNVPQGFKTWCEKHKEKLTDARKANKLPYFVRDNEKVVGKIVGWKEKETSTKKLTKREQIRENARKRHEARTDKEINDILLRWDERKYTDAQKENFRLLEDVWFIKREKSMSFEKANQGKGNIGYKKGCKEYRVNCQSSVVAHELRMRGFDVTAQPNWKLGDDPNKLSYGTWQCWNNQDGTPFKNPEPFAYKFGKSGNILGVPYKDVVQQLSERTQEVGRYHVSFQWKGEKYGHIVTMERKADGSTLWYDPQTGERDFFDKEYAKKIKFARAYRVDNLVFNPEWNVVRPIAKESFETTYESAKNAYELRHGKQDNKKTKKSTIGTHVNLNPKLIALRKQAALLIPNGNTECKNLLTKHFYVTRETIRKGIVHAETPSEINMFQIVCNNPSLLQNGVISPLGATKNLNDAKDQKNIEKKNGITHFNVYTFRYNGKTWIAKCAVYKNKKESLYCIYKK